MWNPEAKTEQKPKDVEWRIEPFYPVRLAGPAKLHFALSKHVEQFSFTVSAPGANNGAQVALLRPDGKEAAGANGEFDDPLKLDVTTDIQPGIWAIEIKEIEGMLVRDVRLRADGLLPYLSPTPGGVLTPMEKTSSLIGWWKFNEGQGTVAADSSGPPPFNGTISGATWTDGRSGKALSFDGHGQSVVVPHNYVMDNLREFAVMAWVKLTALPTPGNGGTLVNKGPEAPVQHFWLWIGYPPGYALILELGNEKLRYGHGFSSGKLAWETGRWYHVAASCFSQKGITTVRLYRDGALVGEEKRDDAFDSGACDLRIGAYGGIHALNGVIDEAKLFNQALGPDEIRREASAR